MAALTIRNAPDDVKQALRAKAARHRSGVPAGLSVAVR